MATALSSARADPNPLSGFVEGLVFNGMALELDDRCHVASPESRSKIETVNSQSAALLRGMPAAAKKVSDEHAFAVIAQAAHKRAERIDCNSAAIIVAKAGRLAGDAMAESQLFIDWTATVRAQELNKRCRFYDNAATAVLGRLAQTLAGRLAPMLPQADLSTQEGVTRAIVSSAPYDQTCTTEASRLVLGRGLQAIARSERTSIKSTACSPASLCQLPTGD